MTDYLSPGNEFHWLMSAFAGIAMCKIVFELTDIVSPFFFKEYPKLSDGEKLEWSNRGFSTFHALVVAVASLYLLLLSDLFDEDSHTELIIVRRSTLSDTILGVLHHGLSMFSIFLSLVSGQGLVYIIMVLFTESTTPFVNLRWYLDIAGQKNSKLYVCNGVALFFGWLAADVHAEM
ncbi:TRAM, LAG1 and CLN8 (TLC) lipid-sensing domain containing protein [Actinidia rufa]|uniref:TRAM, LAG1 and CLN8 (TLC) lipid-sensing domain containing protein n=1 Tax=Actinidia rufa TaxID=165716 RepID=A0A7J0GRF2_9ERIC|nr:TRAM, LAG1 and CLN8 (TLC) lipid-sensing domain containing protein [Actinidia rufa]